MGGKGMVRGRRTCPRWWRRPSRRMDAATMTAQTAATAHVGVWSSALVPTPLAAPPPPPSPPISSRRSRRSGVNELPCTKTPPRRSWRVEAGECVKAERRKNGGRVRIEFRRKGLSAHVWNEGSGTDLSRGTATKLVLLEERKNEVRSKGKFSTVLALTLSALKPIFAPAIFLFRSTASNHLGTNRHHLHRSEQMCRTCDGCG